MNKIYLDYFFLLLSKQKANVIITKKQNLTGRRNVASLDIDEAVSVSLHAHAIKKGMNLFFPSPKLRVIAHLRNLAL